MPNEHVQTKHDIQGILASLDLRPQKRFGQHFLIDGNLMRKLVEAADPTPRDTVLEVGGGTGGLTDLLARRAGRLIVVEVADRLAPFLVRRFADRDNVRVLRADVLRSKSRIEPAVIDALETAPPDGGAYMLVANLPYQVATPLIMNLLTADVHFERFCFSIQHEVARRLLAAPNCSDYGPLSIAVQTACTVNRIAHLPPEAYWPAPKVASAILRMDAIAHPFQHADALRRFIDLLHVAFAHRRKTLRYNLSRILDSDALDRCALDLTRRAQQVGVAEWIDFARTVLQP